MPFIMTFLQDCVKSSFNIIGPIKKFFNRYNKVTIDYKTVSTPNGFMHSYNDTNVDVVKAILWKISQAPKDSDKKNKRTTIKLRLGDALEFDDRATTTKSRALLIRPDENFQYGDYWIKYTESNEIKDKQTISMEQVTVESLHDITDINRWIKSTLDEYIDHRFDDTQRFKPAFYKQIIGKTGVRYAKYKIKNKTGFDQLFFSQKKRLIQMLDKLKCGELAKLSILLHGLPGCGKTSIIKALAQYMGYSIVEVKLSYLFNDDDLTKIFHDTSMQMSDGIYETVPLNRRIYILEDVDAECTIIHERSSMASKDSAKEDRINVKDFHEYLLQSKLLKGITLSGILNVMDGVMEIHGSIVVLTTNYVDRLDKALTRPGRITLNLHMRPLRTKDAMKILQMHYPGETVKLQCIDNMGVTPALLDGLCRQCLSLEQVLRIIYG